MNAGLLDYGFIAPLGMGAVLTVFILSLHVIWSICVPIGLVELLFPRRRTEPWLGKTGLAFCGVFYAAGGAMIGLHYFRMFNAAPFQHLITALMAAPGLAIAFWAFPSGKPPAPLPGNAPSPWVVGMSALVGTSVMMLLFQNGLAWHIPAAVTVVAIVALDAAGLFCIFRAARRAGWANTHRFALVAGALLTYCWSGFITLIAQHGPGTVPGHAALVAAFLALLVFLWRRLRGDAAGSSPSKRIPISS